MFENRLSSWIEKFKLKLKNFKVWSFFFIKRCSVSDPYHFDAVLLPDQNIDSLILLELYSEDTFTWYLHMLFGLVVFVNIAGNFLGLWLDDTSARYQGFIFYRRPGGVYFWTRYLKAKAPLEPASSVGMSCMSVSNT